MSSVPDGRNVGNCGSCGTAILCQSPQMQIGEKLQMLKMLQLLQLQLGAAPPDTQVIWLPKSHVH
jgi:hypothetical protein